MSMILRGTLEAIVSAYAESGITAPLYYGVAPRTASPPYVIYNVIEARPDDDMSSYVTETVVQFSVWSTSPSPGEAVDIAEALAATYDDATLSVTGGICYRCDREMMTIERSLDETGWAAHISYRLHVQEV
jgi:hypothetical protein